MSRVPMQPTRRSQPARRHDSSAAPVNRIAGWEPSLTELAGQVSAGRMRAASMARGGSLSDAPPGGMGRILGPVWVRECSQPAGRRDPRPGALTSARRQRSVACHAPPQLPAASGARLPGQGPSRDARSATTAFRTPGADRATGTVSRAPPPPRFPCARHTRRTIPNTRAAGGRCHFRRPAPARACRGRGETSGRATRRSSSPRTT